jgi:hypothetical protein
MKQPQEERDAKQNEETIFNRVSSAGLRRRFYRLWRGAKRRSERVRSDPESLVRKQRPEKKSSHAKGASCVTRRRSIPTTDSRSPETLRLQRRCRRRWTFCRHQSAQIRVWLWQHGRAPVTTRCRHSKASGIVGITCTMAQSRVWKRCSTRTV